MPPSFLSPGVNGLFPLNPFIALKMAINATAKKAHLSKL
jgi:hypothetical protein